ncbi:MAG: gamma-glutamyltransferase [Pseudomonadales bacterium]
MRFTYSLLLLAAMQFTSHLALAASPEAAHARNGLVTSRSALASAVGVQIMKDGGNAVDAAVATGFALAVTHPSGGNIGGGGFAVIRLTDGTVVTLDHRETAPASAYADMYLDDEGNVIKGLSTRSHKASGTPGSVDGLLVLLEKYGLKSRQEVLAPVIKLAEKGFPLTRSLARSIESQLQRMEAYPASMAKFSNNGVPYESGDVWKQPDLAKTLKLISKKGRDGFYKGSIAAKIAEEMKRGGGGMTAKDLADYRSKWRPAIKSNYRGYEIWGMGPPSSGGILIAQIFNMLELYDLKAMGWSSSELIHTMVEAERRAYADRAQHLGDPDYYEVPTEMLINKRYAKHRFMDFDLERATPSALVGSGSWPEESMETTHFSVMDKSGMMVSLTTTLNSGYGSKIVVPGTGILMNNEMDDFSVKANIPNQYNVIGGIANSIAPGKRMLSSMSPTLITKDGEPFMVVGSPGGATIITTTLQVISNVIDHELEIGDAVSLPRFHHQWVPDSISYDGFRISADTKKRLEEMGHINIQKARSGRGIGDANAILYKDGIIHGIKDPRNEGGAIGF